MASAEDTSKREVCSDVCNEGAGGTSSVQAEMTTLLTAGMPAPAAPATNRPEGPEEILFADADAVLNATHSVSDVSSADTQRTSNAYDPFAPTPQELKRQEEGVDLTNVIPLVNQKTTANEHLLWSKSQVPHP